MTSLAAGAAAVGASQYARYESLVAGLLLFLVLTTFDLLPIFTILPLRVHVNIEHIQNDPGLTL